MMQIATVTVVSALLPTELLNWFSQNEGNVTINFILNDGLVFFIFYTNR